MNRNRHPQPRHDRPEFSGSVLTSTEPLTANERLALFHWKRQTPFAYRRFERKPK